jgi:exodeoxyribonuclease-1
MAASFFFYDLETTGFNPRSARIMQFAGQRTDMELRPIGEPVNVLIKLTPDILPEPDAILVTGITPQQTIAEGVSEAEFLKLFFDEVVKPDTIFVGFNNVRFDDEFMRFLLYRNFYDAYEWQWKDSCSRWDILDVVRTVRALKPDGIKWPLAPDGKPTNRLEYLTKLNKLDHEKAHDALNDVYATIAVAKLLKEKQPALFQHLLELRKKDKVRQIVQAGSPFMYTSGRYPSEALHTSPVISLGHPTNQDAALVYDLRHDPTSFTSMSVEELISAWKFSKDPEILRLPVKTIKFNRCPAIVPGVVKDESTLERLQLSRDKVQKNLTLLQQQLAEFVPRLFQALTQMDDARSQSQVALVDNELTVDERLYESFIDKRDLPAMRTVRSASPAALSGIASELNDSRLKNLLPLYKARNYPSALSSEESKAWDAFCAKKLLTGGEQSRLAKYFSRLQELAASKLSSPQHYILEELQLYGESIMPVDEGGDY